ncbi:hypothetical protein D3C78_1898830 [compost metagenome]
MQRAVPGFDVRVILDVLDKAGWITARDKDGKRSKKVKMDGTSIPLYHLRPVDV